MFAAPKTEQELLARANELAGQRLADLAKLAGVQMPKDLRRHKGWPGQLIELLLGATAGSKPVPDFQHLGIELKTLPIDQRGKPLETTFVCAAPLTSFNGVTWQTSHVRNKMACVLWVPLIAERSIPLAERQVASPFLWRPDEEEDWLLRQDWEELTELIVLGQYQSISAKHGQVMQLRPKAANSSVTTSAFDQNGKPIKTLPLGFYLKTQFTQHLVNKYLIVN